MLSRSLRSIAIGLILMAMVISGCVQRPSAASMDVANATADRVLSSLGSGSYAEYTQNFSEKMMAEVDENNFTYIRNTVKDMFGDYVSRSGPVASVSQGYDVFVYNCTFTKGHVRFVLSMNTTNTSRVEGVGFLKPSAGE